MYVPLLETLHALLKNNSVLEQVCALNMMYIYVVITLNFWV